MKDQSNNDKSVWDIQKDKLRIEFPLLTDDDLNFDESQRNEMFSHLQDKLGMTPNEIEVIALA